MSGPKTPVSRAEMALAEVRDATRELNAAIAEAREVMRLMDAKVEEVSSLAKDWRENYEAQLQQQYLEGVDNYYPALKATMDEHTAAIKARLDTLIIAVTKPIHGTHGVHSFEQVLLGQAPPPAGPPPKMRPKERKRR